MQFGFDFIHQLAGSSKILDAIAIFFGSWFPFIFIALFIIALFTRHQWRERISLLLFTLFSILLASGVVKEIINFLFPIDRPFVAQGFTPLITHGTGPSFPSGHATFFFTVATVIFLQMSGRWGIIAYIAALLIGFGRVFAGVHYPIDIVGGLVIGMVVPVLVRVIMPKAENKEPEELPVENEPQTL